MMKTRIKQTIVIILFACCAPPASFSISAANPVVAIEGMAYRLDQTMRDNLKGLEGKMITVTTDAGIQFSGRVKALGNGLLHLSNIKGKSFMDALIRIDRIIAIEAQFRAYQRDLERMKQK